MLPAAARSELDMVELSVLQIVAPKSVTKKVILQFVVLVVYANSELQAKKDFGLRDLGLFELEWRLGNLQENAVKREARNCNATGYRRSRRLC